jgi:predicted dehydrogenase
MLARESGARACLREEAEQVVQSFSGGHGCDAVLICADTPSSDPVELAGEIARDRARVVAVGAVGLNLPRKLYFAKELTFMNSRSYGPGRYDPAYEEGGQDYPIGYVRWTEGRNMEAFANLLAAGKIDVFPLISHRFPIERAPQAYQLITGKTQEPFLGVLLTYPAEEVVKPTSQVEFAPGAKTYTQSGSEFKPVSAPRLGVLGAGSFATSVLLPALRGVPGVELVGIASASGMSAQQAAKRFGFSYACSDEAEIINDPQINSVAILTRHDLHAPQVLASLQAGKHVFCEKPLALNLDELEQIEAYFENKERSEKRPGAQSILTVGFNRRFSPLAKQLKAFFENRNEPFVAHYRVNGGYLPLTHWLHDPAVGGGRIIGEGCHFIDFLTFLAGEAPISVNAAALPDTGRYREDNVVMNFIYPDRSIGTVSYLANGDKSLPKERLEVFCGGRVAVLDDYRSLTLLKEGHKQIIRSRLRQDKGHQAEMAAFAAAITGRGPLPIPYQHLFSVTRASFAAVSSLRTGEVIPLG